MVSRGLEKHQALGRRLEYARAHHGISERNEDKCKISLASRRNARSVNRKDLWRTKWKAYIKNIGSEPNTMTIEFRKPIQRRPLRTCHQGRGFAEPRNPLPRDRTTVDIIGSVEHRRTIGCVAKGSHHAGFPAVRIYNYGTTFEEFKSAYRSSERRTKRRSDSQGKVSDTTTTTFRSNAS